MIFLAATPAQANVDWTLLFTKMGWVDAVFLFVFALGVFFGLRKGLARIFPGLFGVMLAQLMTIEYGPPIAGFLETKLQVPTQALQVIIFVILAVGAILAVRFLFQLLSFFVSVEFRQPLNNVGAAIFGGLQFVLYLCLMVSFLSFFQFPFVQTSLTEGSVSGPYLLQSTQQVHDFFIRWLPNNWRAK